MKCFPCTGEESECEEVFPRLGLALQNKLPPIWTPPCAITGASLCFVRLIRLFPLHWVSIDASGFISHNLQKNGVKTETWADKWYITQDPFQKYLTCFRPFRDRFQHVFFLLILHLIRQQPVTLLIITYGLLTVDNNFTHHYIWPFTVDSCQPGKFAYVASQSHGIAKAGVRYEANMPLISLEGTTAAGNRLPEIKQIPHSCI